MRWLRLRMLGMVTVHNLDKAKRLTKIRPLARTAGMALCLKREGAAAEDSLLRILPLVPYPRCMDATAI